MKRAWGAVPVALAIVTAGAVSVAQASPAKHPTAHPVTSTVGHPTSPTVVSHRGSTTNATNTAITSAITHSSLLGDVPASDVSVRSIRVASANTAWASAVVHPNDQRTDDAAVALHRVGGRWTVVTLGTAGVGCVVPASLRSSLHLICEGGY